MLLLLVPLLIATVTSSSGDQLLYEPFVKQFTQLASLSLSKLVSVCARTLKPWEFYQD